MPDFILLRRTEDEWDIVPRSRIYSVGQSRTDDTSVVTLRDSDYPDASDEDGEPLPGDTLRLEKVKVDEPFESWETRLCGEVIPFPGDEVDQ